MTRFTFHPIANVFTLSHWNSETGEWDQDEALGHIAPAEIPVIAAQLHQKAIAQFPPEMGLEV